MVLFHSVVLSDAATLYRFSIALGLGCHLSGYVRELILTGRYLHTTKSIFALFPSVLRGKVPNLRDLHIVHIQEDANWYLESPAERRQRKLQCVPLHFRFPLLLSSAFLAIKYLHLEDITFCYFSDFIRMVNSLRNLQRLVCYNLRWLTLGVLPACMARRVAAQPSFVPNLEELLIKSLGIYGAERLVFALGFRLVELCIGIPYFDPSERPLHDAANPSPTTGLGIDLSDCSKLEWLYIAANPAFLTYAGSSDLVSAILRSWQPPSEAVQDPVVIFFTNDAQAFSRHAFVDVLQALGRIVEDWFRDVSEAADAPGLRQSLKVRVYDWEKWRGWWWEHVQICFPMWGRLRRFDMEFLTPRNEDDVWKADTVPS